MIWSQHEHNLRMDQNYQDFLDNLERADAVWRASFDLLAVVRRYLHEYDPEAADADPCCIECTAGTVPNRLNTGLCLYHMALAAKAKAEGE